MHRRAYPLGRLLGVAAVLSTPAAAVLVVLVALARLHPAAALAGLAAVFVLVALLVRPFLQDAAGVVGWVRALAQGIEAPTPAPRRARMAEEAVAAVTHLLRGWQARQAQLAASARWNESLFDHLPDPLVLLGEDRRIVRVNQAAAEAFGGDLTGRDLAAVLRDPGLLEACDAVLAGQAGREIQVTMPVPVERIFRAYVERLGVRAIDGTVAILSLHDLTTSKRMEQMRADFVANASHELRTPLATLLGFIETLKGPARDDAEARDRFLTIMHEQGSRMARLVNDLLSLSRIELHEHSPPSEVVEVPAILDRIVAAMQPLAAAKGMTLQVEVEPGLPPVTGAPDEMAQLFQNLLDNAVKYGRDGTAVEVSVAATSVAALPAAAGRHLRVAGGVAVRVRDHGEGIGKEHLPRLTERFYRVDTARSRKMGGTGLGLAIVKHIVSRHRGALTIDSTPGEGSVFAVFLPRAVPAEGQSAPRRAAG